ncbi:MAG: hypothetical protein ACOC1N_02850 [Bacillota bacterium]
MKKVLWVVFIIALLSMISTVTMAKIKVNINNGSTESWGSEIEGSEDYDQHNDYEDYEDYEEINFDVDDDFWGGYR